MLSRKLLVLALLPTSQFVGAHSVELDTIVVSSAGQQSLYDVAQPVTIIGKDEIDANAGATLGTLLENTPGIANASFGAGVGRPVIRGMSGSRVKILQNGSDSSDVSAMSSDHSPMAEASAAEQVEIIYGPSTLLYGGGAIGGVVNLIDRRIHEQPGAGISGDIATRYSSNDNGTSTDALLDMGSGNFVLHIDGFKREAGNYKSGTQGYLPQGFNHGRVQNSDSEGQGGAIALSWADGENGFIGGSISTLEYDYAVPNTDGDNFRVTPKQTRYDVKGAWRPAFDSAWNFIDEWRTELTVTDYEHQEREPGIAVALFDKESYELQSRIRHQAWRGWQGSVGIQAKYQRLALCHDHDGCSGLPNFNAPWSGNMGTGLSNKLVDGYYFAHSTPMPNTDTQQLGLFIVEQRDWLAGTFELGARIDAITIKADPVSVDPNWRQNSDYYADKNFAPTTLSAAATWVLDDQQRLGFSLARVERAPEATELYWNGDHHATFSYQLDNPDLDKETAYTADINWLYEGERNHVRVATYYYHFVDYIYNDLKDTQDPFHGGDVYRYEQADARFLGAEFSWQYNFTERWHMDIGADVVEARLVDGGYLPRTPPASMLLALNYEHNGWDFRIETKAVSDQHQTAENETNTAGFVLLNAYAGYKMKLQHSELLWHLAAHNITDEYAINHVSYLKRAAPITGQNLQAGVRWRF